SFFSLPRCNGWNAGHSERRTSPWEIQSCDNGALQPPKSELMISGILGFIFDIVFLLFGIALIVRAWAYAIRLHPFNPYSQAVIRLTDWLVQPIRKLVPPRGKVDLPSLLACWLTALVYLLATWVVLTGQLP